MHESPHGMPDEQCLQHVRSGADVALLRECSTSSKRSAEVGELAGFAVLARCFAGACFLCPVVFGSDTSDFAASLDAAAVAFGVEVAAIGFGARSSD